MGILTPRSIRKWSRLAIAIIGGLSCLGLMLMALASDSTRVLADPIPPPEGFPKLSVSIKNVTPTLAHTGGVTLYYSIEIRNTGAYTAAGATLVDVIPTGTTYNGDAGANNGIPVFADDTLTWTGDVGFDSTTILSFSVTVSPTVTGIVRNTAVVSHHLVARAVTITAETTVTDVPLLVIAKTSEPPRPGPGGVITYTIEVANWGQPAIDLPITVVDYVPVSTTLHSIGQDAITDTVGGSTVITWTHPVTLELGETTYLTFSASVGDAPSGTVITNEYYQVSSPVTGITVGRPYTVTIVDPIFTLFKTIWPNPPGSNREMTYTLTLFNEGSVASDLVITDRVPSGVEYRRGGFEAGGVVSWTLPRLDTYGWAEFTFTVYISDVMNIPIVNDDYRVCCEEGVCEPGNLLVSTVRGPNFETYAEVAPIAHKPGGGTGTYVTATLSARNVGPGNALSATARLEYQRISVSSIGAIDVTPSIGVLRDGPDCGSKCRAFIWVGDLYVGDAITFTAREQSTIGAEGSEYIATIVITDGLSNMSTDPDTAEAIGVVVQKANLTPVKSGPPVIGRGQLMTYTIDIYNFGLSTDGAPWLLEYVPISTTVVYISDGGVTQTVTDTLSTTFSAVISWTLPPMSTGEALPRSFSVRVDNDLVSGTQIVNEGYTAFWINAGVVYSNTGEPLTTTVQEVGLSHSFKLVTPTTSLPGSNVVLTYYLHIVNSSAFSLSNVTAYDLLPWQFSTYQRNAVPSSGQIVSDIISVQWTGDVPPLSSEVVTFTVLVDPDFQGLITNTAVLSHPSLLHDVAVGALAYITEKPVLEISKHASPDPVERGSELAYTIRVLNRGQQATTLVITDVIPENTTYVEASATGGGHLEGDHLVWGVPFLESGESRSVAFQVTVNDGSEVVNERYGVGCLGCEVVLGAPVTTMVSGGGSVYLPLVQRSY